MPLAPGTKLGPYEIQSPLGAGGMGEVYRARDSRLERDVAIKVLPAGLAVDSSLRQRLEREAKAVSKLSHPHICTLHDIGDQDGVVFLVMELLEGVTLEQRLNKGPLPLEQTIRYGAQIADALAKAHRMGFTHRDLKPANIMLTKAGAKLMDFGLAKHSATAPLASALTEMTAEQSKLTGDGMLVGTFQYMAPEQLEGKEADARTDIFALGEVLYEMATGKPAFSGKSRASLIASILTTEPPPITQLQPLTPPALERIVKKCLAKDPDERWQSASDLASELKWMIEGAVKTGSQQIVSSWSKALKILFWTTASLGALALILGGAILLTRNNDLNVRYTRITYREGSLQAARFSRDGQTIVYSGEWEGEPPQVAVARLGSPESRALGIPQGAIASVSSSDELAVLQQCEMVYLNNCIGTLGTVSLAGGSPRNMAEHVAYADWAPDGRQLVLSVYSRDGTRLEFPPGHVLYQQKTGWFGHPRFSPQGNLIAYENHPFANNDEGSLEVIDLNGKRTVLVNSSLSLEGLAWSPDGKEIWYAGASHAGWADTIYKVTTSGKTRVVSSLPSGVRLHDISRDGRVLLSRETWSTQLKGFFPGDQQEHPYSWLDSTSITAISSDGRAISLYEAGDVYYIERDALAYYRSTDGSAAVRLGPGRAALSPDGKWLLEFGTKTRKLALQPVGPGEAKDLPTSDLDGFNHLVWSDNGRYIAYEAHTSKNEWNVYIQHVESGLPSLVKSTGLNAFPVPAPDGGMLALREERGGISLYRTNGSQPVPIKGVLESEYPIRFVNAGRSLLVANPTRQELVLTEVDVASGNRKLWKQFTTKSEVGTAAQLFVVTPDLKYYAYQSPRYLSDLYVADNVR